LHPGCDSTQTPSVADVIQVAISGTLPPASPDEITMAASPTPFDPTRCPLCGQANSCVLAAGGELRDCWCLQTPMDPAVLERLPAEERDRRCLCPACAAGVAGESR